MLVSRAIYVCYSSWNDGWNVDHQYSLLRLIGQIVLTRPDRTAKQVKRPGFQYVEESHSEEYCCAAAGSDTNSEAPQNTATAGEENGS